MTSVTLRNLGEDVVVGFLNAISRLRNCLTMQSEVDSERFVHADDTQSEKERFDLWSANIGLFQLGDRSLDYRLQDDIAVKDFTIALLDDLRENLSDMLDLLPEFTHEPQDGSDPYCLFESNNLDPNLQALDTFRYPINVQEVLSHDLGNETSSSADSIHAISGPIKAFLTDIVDVIDRLYRLAAKLRSPTNRTLPSARNFYRQTYTAAAGNICTPTREERACIQKQCEGIHTRRIEEIIRQLRVDRRATRDDLDTDDQESHAKMLVGRMGRSNATRQQQFIFWRNREHERRDHTLKRVAGLPSAPETKTTSTNAEKQLGLTPVAEASKASISEQPSHTWQLPKGSLPGKYLQVENAVSVGSSWAPTNTPTEYEPGGEKVGWPEFPKGLQGKGTFQCPYCFVLCPPSYRGKAHWRSHLIQDLLPYMCTYPGCSKGDRNVLMTSESWLVHETMYHRMAYRCETHPLLSFSTRAQYVEHVENNHPEDKVVLLNDDEIANRASPIARPDRDCPFCLQTASNWEEMDKHIGFHLESLALLALPLTMGLERDFGQGEDSKDSQNGEDGDADTRYAGYDAGHTVDQSITGRVKNADVLQGGDSLTGATISAWEVHMGRHDLLPSIHEFVSSIDWSNIHHDKSEGFDVLEHETRTVADGNMEDQDADAISPMQSSDDMEFAKLEPRGRLDDRIIGPPVKSTSDARTKGPPPEDRTDKPIVHHPNTLASVNNLASVLQDQGKYNEAEKLNQRALEGREKKLGVQHPDTLTTSISNLASVLQDQGKYNEAEKLNRRALEWCEKELGVQHPDTLLSVSNLASVLKHQGKYDEAEKLNWRALEGREKELGVHHPFTLSSVNNLASVLRHQGKYDEAEKLNRRALEGREKELGVQHPDTLLSVSNLALVLKHQGKYDEAEKLNWRALEGREKKLGVQHLDTLTSVSNLASVLQCQGKYNEAEKLNRRALEWCEKELGVHHPFTLSSVSNLASVLQYQGKYNEAEKLNRRALEWCKKELGAHHPKTLTSVNNLASVLRHQGKHNEVERLNW